MVHHDITPKPIVHRLHCHPIRPVINLLFPPLKPGQPIFEFQKFIQHTLLHQAMEHTHPDCACCHNIAPTLVLALILPCLLISTNSHWYAQLLLLQYFYQPPWLLPAGVYPQWVLTLPDHIMHQPLVIILLRTSLIFGCIVLPD